MNKTTTFKEPFESKLKKLRVKRAFLRNAKDHPAIDSLNDEPNFESFIGGAFIWKETPQGHDFWECISKH